MCATRLTAIEIDLPIAGPVPDRWSDAHVRRRLVEAYAIERRLPATRRMQRRTGSWPEIRHEFSDLVGWGDDAREHALDAWATTRGSVYADELARMNEAQDWFRLLAAFPIERACLMQWATSIAYRWPLASMLTAKRWSRTTFYRRAYRGSLLIAQELDARRVPVS